jgi:uncharacterized LabA/DUF88 family protein
MTTRVTRASPSLAVLIDADNASAKIVDALFDEIAKIGDACARRIYGDFSTTNLHPWAKVLVRHAITPMQQFPYTTGKNASDITLVIDAMDLLHSGRFDGFCIVSSDGDFTRLATRIREHGLDVYGFGEQKTPESFKQACRRFIYTENLVPPVPIDQSVQAPAKPKLTTASKLLRKTVDQMESEDGWVNLSEVKKQISKLAPDFDQRSYGHAKLSDLVRATSNFEIRTPTGRGMEIRWKNERPAKVAATGAPRAA